MRKWLLLTLIVVSVIAAGILLVVPAVLAAPYQFPCGREWSSGSGGSFTSPNGEIIDAVIVKAGNTCFGPFTGDGTYEDSAVNLGGNNWGTIPNSCYAIVGIGTSSIAVTKVGLGHAQVCQTISHIEGSYGEEESTPTATEEDPTDTPTPTETQPCEEQDGDGCEEPTNTPTPTATFSCEEQDGDCEETATPTPTPTGTLPPPEPSATPTADPGCTDPFFYNIRVVGSGAGAAAYVFVTTSEGLSGAIPLFDDRTTGFKELTPSVVIIKVDVYDADGNLLGTVNINRNGSACEWLTLEVDPQIKTVSVVPTSTPAPLSTGGESMLGQLVPLGFGLVLIMAIGALGLTQWKKKSTRA